MLLESNKTTFLIFVVLVLGFRCSDSRYELFFPQDSLSSQLSGLYILNPSELGLKQLKALMPLKAINYNLDIVNSLAHITLYQLYQNPTDKYLNVYYSIPLNPESSLYKLSAKFDDTIIQGIIKEKQDAKKQFQRAKKQGRKAVLSYINSNSKDIIHLNIGNINPRCYILITVVYVVQMKVSMSKFYSIQIPSTISPRFMNSIPIQQNNQKYRTFDSQQNDLSQQILRTYRYVVPPTFNWYFNITVRSTKKITFYKSNTHPLVKMDWRNDGKQINLRLSQQSLPIKDFNFYYTTEDFDKPNYVIGQSKLTTTVMVSFIPKLSQLSNKEAYNLLNQNANQQYDLDTIKGQYIFILDRSGSMENQRIQRAKDAVILFLKSLPKDSYFNVVSFGSQFQFLYQKSVKYENSITKQAIKQINNMDANMGGTQIYFPIQKVLDDQVIRNYPKTIFLLTDGNVINTQDVIRMVKKNAINSRLYSIGVGNGASQRLVQGCAQAGRGKYIMISDSQDPAQKIIDLLQSAMTPYITSLILSYNNEDLISIYPQPSKIPYFLKDEALNFYLIYKGQKRQNMSFALQYQDSKTRLFYQSEITINPQSKNYQFVDKMANFKILRALQQLSHDMKSPINNYLSYQKLNSEDQYKKQAIEFSIKHQILSQYTSLIGYSRTINRQARNRGKSLQLTVPQSLPLQYLNQNPIKYFLKFFSPDPGDIVGDTQGSYISDLQMQYSEPILPSKQQLDPQYNNLRQSTQKYSQEQQNLKQVINSQNIDGSWNDQSLIALLYKDCRCKLQIEGQGYQIKRDIIVTKLVLQWLIKYTQGKKYSLIIKKAQKWLQNILIQDNISDKLLQGLGK